MVSRDRASFAAGIAFAAGLMFTGANPCAANLETEMQARVRKATFEVVMRKPAQDTITYERPLPLDQLPYTERTDKYRSVGTAFAISDGRFVSAAHVFNVGFASHYGEPALRDA